MARRAEFRLLGFDQVFGYFGCMHIMAIEAADVRFVVLQVYGVGLLFVVQVALRAGLGSLRAGQGGVAQDARRVAGVGVASAGAMAGFASLFIAAFVGQGLGVGILGKAVALTLVAIAAGFGADISREVHVLRAGIGVRLGAIALILFVRVGLR